MCTCGDTTQETSHRAGAWLERHIGHRADHDQTIPALGVQVGRPSKPGGIAGISSSLGPITRPALPTSSGARTASKHVSAALKADRKRLTDTCLHGTGPPPPRPNMTRGPKKVLSGSSPPLGHNRAIPTRNQHAYVVAIEQNLLLVCHLRPKCTPHIRRGGASCEEEDAQGRHFWSTVTGEEARK